MLVFPHQAATAFDATSQEGVAADYFGVATTTLTVPQGSSVLVSTVEGPHGQPGKDLALKRDPPAGYFLTLQCGPISGQIKAIHHAAKLPIRGF